MKVQLWQLFDEQGRPITANGAQKHEVAVRGLLHGAVHLWLWRRSGTSVELMLQKRAASKVNWPNLLDKSAGGHIAFGEAPIDAVLRKTKGELGIELSPQTLQLAGVQRWYATFGEERLIENELQFVYLAEMGEAKLAPSAREVQAIIWKSSSELSTTVWNNGSAEGYVPYGKAYYQLLSEAIVRLDRSGPQF